MKRSLVLFAVMAMVLSMMALPSLATSHVNEDDNLPTTTLNEQPQAFSGNDSESCPEGTFYRINGEDVGDGPDLESSEVTTDDGVTFIVTVPSEEPHDDASDAEKEKSLDFEVIDGVVHEVRVKGGPNGYNLYDYIGGDDFSDGPVSGDTFLHSPPGNREDTFGGLSHISFCYTPGEPDIEIEKTAVEDTITVGDKAAFDITVTSTGTGGVAAENVTIDDDLPNDVLDWTVVSEDGVEDPESPKCGITEGNSLFCDVGTLEVDESFTVRVETTEAILQGSTKCNTTLTNTAYANADDVEEVDDTASIDVDCASILLLKEYSAATPATGDKAEFALSPGDTFDEADSTDMPLLNEDPDLYCLDGLAVDGKYTISETTTPDGYETVEDVTHTATNTDTCDDRIGTDGEDYSDGDADVEIINEAAPVDLIVTKFKLGWDETLNDGAGGTYETDTPLEGFRYELYEGTDTTADSIATKSTGSDGEVLFEDLEVGEEFTVCETGVPEGEDGYWTGADCQTFTTEIDTDATLEFFNAPRADVEVGFTDVTSFASAIIECTDADDNVVASDTFTSSDTLDLGTLDLGDYDCSIKIRNGDTDLNTE